MHHSELQEERRGLNYINLITQDSLVGMKVSTISLIAYEDIRIITILHLVDSWMKLHLSDVYNLSTDTLLMRLDMKLKIWDDKKRRNYDRK